MFSAQEKLYTYNHQIYVDSFLKDVEVENIQWRNHAQEGGFLRFEIALLNKYIGQGIDSIGIKGYNLIACTGHTALLVGQCLQPGTRSCTVVHNTALTAAKASF